MTPGEVAAIKRSAEAELNANEEAMLITPLAVLEICDMLERCQRKVEAIGAYDELHDA